MICAKDSENGRIHERSFQQDLNIVEIKLKKIIIRDAGHCIGCMQLW